MSKELIIKVKSFAEVQERLLELQKQLDEMAIEVHIQQQEEPSDDQIEISKASKEPEKNAQWNRSTRPQPPLVDFVSKVAQISNLPSFMQDGLPWLSLDTGMGLLDLLKGMDKAERELHMNFYAPETLEDDRGLLKETIENSFEKMIKQE